MGFCSSGVRTGQLFGKINIVVMWKSLNNVGCQTPEEVSRTNIFKKLEVVVVAISTTCRLKAILQSLSVILDSKRSPPPCGG